MLIEITTVTTTVEDTTTACTPSLTGTVSSEYFVATEASSTSESASESGACASTLSVFASTGANLSCAVVALAPVVVDVDEEENSLTTTVVVATVSTTNAVIGGYCCCWFFCCCLCKRRRKKQKPAISKADVEQGRLVTVNIIKQVSRRARTQEAWMNSRPSLASSMH